MNLLSISILTLSLPFLTPYANATTNVLLYEYISAAGEELSFYTRAELLISCPTWNPDHGHFPLGLRKESEAARSHIRSTQKAQYPIEINDVAIYPIGRPIISNGGQLRAGPEFTNHWFVRFRLYEKRPTVSATDQSTFAIMLLNGHIVSAKARVRDDAARSLPPTNYAISNSVIPLGEAKSKLVFGATNDLAIANGHLEGEATETQPSSHGSSPMHFTAEPDFKLPEVQWDPFVEDLPVDLSLQQRLAKAYVSKMTQTDVAKMQLKSIHLDNFVPSEAVRAQHLDMSSHLRHWAIVFSFGSEENGTRKNASVWMLLDGRVLGLQAF